MPNDTRKGWSRQELIIAFNGYCRIPFGRLNKSNPEIVRLALAMGRTPSALAMKLVNFASLDPVQQARGIKGLANVGKKDREIWEEFHRDWEGLAHESQQALESLRPGAKGDEVSPDALRLPSGETDRIAEVRIRTVQSFFRTVVLSAYNSTCAVCSVDIECLLIASHIIPWSVDVTRRADPTNGLSLCALHDRAFDSGLFTVDDSLVIHIAKRLLKRTSSRVQQVALQEINGDRLRCPDRFRPDPNALRYHREVVFNAVK